MGDAVPTSSGLTSARNSQGNEGQTTKVAGCLLYWEWSSRLTGQDQTHSPGGHCHNLEKLQFDGSQNGHGSKNLLFLCISHSPSLYVYVQIKNDYVLSGYL